jgi:hypothetical protein
VHFLAPPGPYKQLGPFPAGLTEYWSEEKSEKSTTLYSTRHTEWASVQNSDFYSENDLFINRNYLVED